MNFGAEDIRIWLCHCAERMISSAPELNELDARLGDGDLGVTLEKCGEQMLSALVEQEDHQPADYFKASASACIRASGSSFGTLMGVAYMTVAKETAGKEELEFDNIAPLISTVIEALMARGGGKLGDKTALDSLDAIRRAIQRANQSSNLKEMACQAADKAIDALLDQPNKIGRARMFADKSIGLKDPGIVAVSRIIGSDNGRA